MRLGPLLIAFVLGTLAGCSGGSTTPTVAITSSAAGRWPSAIELPSIRTVGDLPPMAQRIDVGIDAAGMITVNGDATDLPGLFARLEAEADVESGIYSELNAVLAFDRTLPWIVALRCFQQCAYAGVVRTFIAVRHEDDGTPGAIAMFLPRYEGQRWPDIIDLVTVTVDDAGPPSDAAALYAPLRDIREHNVARFGIAIAAPESAEVKFVLRLADVAAIEGVTTIMLPFPPGRLTEADTTTDVRRLASRERPRHVSVRGTEIAASIDAAPPPAPARVVGSYVGFVENTVIAETDKPIETDER